MEQAIRHLCDAIEYPDEVPEEDGVCLLRVDGGDVRALVRNGRLVLSKVISREEKDLVRLAAFAAGRILREEAILAWDERAAVCILWQEISAEAESVELKKFFESFMDSCDWWQTRKSEFEVPQAAFPNIVIRP
ncbi:MAG: CesT family type III secretion system chaperone [Lentisphaeria bacterium]|nr:CesT family type III secretion system chaperone [Lentisphaeria bacterium]